MIHRKCEKDNEGRKLERVREKEEWFTDRERESGKGDDGFWGYVRDDSYNFLQT